MINKSNDNIDLLSEVSLITNYEQGIEPTDQELEQASFGCIYLLMAEAAKRKDKPMMERLLDHDDGSLLMKHLAKPSDDGEYVGTYTFTLTHL